MMKRPHGNIILIIFIAVVVSIILFSAENRLISAVTSPPPTPWHCIGGCGLGGSGAGGGNAGLRWVGKGVEGYLLTVECMPLIASGKNYGSVLVAPRIALHPRWSTEIGLTLPLAGLKIAELHQQDNFPDETHVNGGPGDITADVNYKFGNEGAFSLGAAIAFPTGRYDTRRSIGQPQRILPNDLQMGRGIYEASLTFSHTWTIENGLILVDASFYYPFNVRPDKRNKYLTTDYRAYRNVTENRERFYYRGPVKPYGESDRGDYYPPSLQLETAYSWFRDAAIVHSLQVSFMAPFGTRWIHHYTPTRYDPYPDTDHRAWSTLLAYGVEFSRFRFPLFAGFGLPISDRRGANNRWDGIDTDALLHEWIFAVGFTVGFF